MNRGVFYRGDTRDPFGDGIFESGFQKKDPHSMIVTPSQPPTFKHSLGTLKAPDVKTTTAVCVTKDLFRGTDISY